MKAHHQLVGLAMGLPMRPHACRKGVYVTWCIVVMVDKTKLWQAPDLGGPGVDRIKYAGRGGSAVLGVCRQNQHTGHALRFELLKLRCDRWVAIAHGVAHFYLVALRCHLGPQQAGLPFGPDLER